MKKLIVLAACIALVLPSFALAWDISGFESANKDRGQWAWFTGQAQQCKEEIPVPGKYTRAEWEAMFTTEKDKLPCGGGGINERAVKHIFLFLHSHAADSDDPMNQKPESCG
jgi:hypothetical protein